MLFAVRYLQSVLDAQGFGGTFTDDDARGHRVPVVMPGMIEASATRRLAIPCALSSLLTTDMSSRPTWPSRTDAERGVDTLRRSLQELHAAPYELLTTPLNVALVQGLAATGRVAEGLALLDDTILSVEANGDLCYMPELLRVKGGLVLTLGHSGPTRLKSTSGGHSK